MRLPPKLFQFYEIKITYFTPSPNYKLFHLSTSPPIFSPDKFFFACGTKFKIFTLILCQTVIVFFLSTINHLMRDIPYIKLNSPCRQLIKIVTFTRSGLAIQIS